VKKILFNDPQADPRGLTVHEDGHDDHLHVRLCGASYPDPRYAAEAIRRARNAAGKKAQAGGSRSVT
jgi:hypothetical protein